MNQNNKSNESVAEIEGTGLCGEAQADGVPCVGTERKCPECDRAIKPVKKPQGQSTCPECEIPLPGGDW